MKILFYIENLRSGGKERRLVELIKGLKKNPDIEMALVLTKNEIHYKDIFNTGIKIYYTIRKGLKKDPRLFYKFYKIAKKYKPDIIHVWGNMVAVYAIPAKVILRTPMINNQITDAPLKVYNGILSHKLTFKFSDKIIANSYAGLKSYSAPINKSMVIYNGFDFNRVVQKLENKDDIRKNLNIKTKYIVAMVATFSKLKDYGTYIKAANLVLKKIPNVTFLCIGSGDNFEFKQMVEVDNISKILFLGLQTNVESIMNICDIGVLTSNIKLHGEGISNALLEFSSLAKPILATNNGGSPELIKDKYNGFLTKPFDAKDLSNRLEYLLIDDVVRYKLGENAKTVVKTKFTIGNMINNFERVYRELFAV